ncbi:hypothetical protein [Nannocystis pusilla]|uniref:hypothetical protein n=1 Tax=Nannocystis pusilla TaxID=889268 RepID=UPI003DA2FCD9
MVDGGASRMSPSPHTITSGSPVVSSSSVVEPVVVSSAPVLVVSDVVVVSVALSPVVVVVVSVVVSPVVVVVVVEGSIATVGLGSALVPVEVGTAGSVEGSLPVDAEVGGPSPLLVVPRSPLLVSLAVESSLAVSGPGQPAEVSATTSASASGRCEDGTEDV